VSDVPAPLSNLMLGVLASIPSPSKGTIEIGPLTLRAYGFMLALGVVAAVWLTSRRWAARGHDPQEISNLALWCVPAGVIGARAYHVASDVQRFEGEWLEAFEIWTGGLSIWGAVAGGVFGAWLWCRRTGTPISEILDTLAPALPLAQAIGRLGNWWNQELYGKPTDLPWALEIDLDHREDGYQQHDTFHPMFLYEMLWNLALVGVLLWAERRFRLRRGRLFALYVCGYTTGRLWIELMRIDPSNEILGLRLNVWTSVVAFAGGLAYLVLRRGEVDEPTVDGASSDAGDDTATSDDGAADDGTSDDEVDGDAPHDDEVEEPESVPVPDAEPMASDDDDGDSAGS
jgi:prolipoprotein diacylglyceryl transferase